MKMTRLHVNRHVILRNRKHHENEPPLRAKDYKTNRAGHRFKIGDETWLVHQPDNPLSCGAVVWIETTLPVIEEQVKS